MFLFAATLKNVNVAARKSTMVSKLEGVEKVHEVVSLQFQKEINDIHRKILNASDCVEDPRYNAESNTA